MPCILSGNPEARGIRPPSATIGDSRKQRPVGVNYAECQAVEADAPCSVEMHTSAFPLCRGGELLVLSAIRDVTVGSSPRV